MVEGALNLRVLGFLKIQGFPEVKIRAAPIVAAS
jgi:hypothetical protein